MAALGSDGQLRQGGNVDMRIQNITWMHWNLSLTSTVTIAMFNHRMHGGVEGALKTAYDFATAQTGFYAIFVSTPPIPCRVKRRKRTNALKETIAQILSWHENVSKNQGDARPALILVNPRLVALVKTVAADDSLLLTSLNQLPPEILGQLQLPVQDILAHLKSHLERNNVKCESYGFSLQSKELAMVVIALDGGSNQDIMRARESIASTFTGCPIPLFLVHVPAKGHPMIRGGCISKHIDSCHESIEWECESANVQ